MELLKFNTRDGLILSGLLYRSGRSNTTAIVNIFGMTSDFFTSERHAELCNASRGAGLDVFMPQNRGMAVVSGFHTTSGKGRYIGTAMERFTESALDIAGAISALRRLGYRRFILMGHSTGCQKALYYMHKSRDRGVRGLVLLSPSDDYNLARKELGRRFAAAVRTAKGMVKRGRGDEITPRWISYYSARRFLSYALPSSAEARLFNYDSGLREFGSLKCPVLVLIGSNDDTFYMGRDAYGDALSRAYKGRRLDVRFLEGCDHSFHGSEGTVARIAVEWCSGL